MCRNETQSTKSRRLMRARWLMSVAGAAIALSAFGQSAMAQEEADDQPFPLNCEDGTKLQALFSENDVTVTLADGNTVKLPFKSDNPDVVFSDGKHQLVEKGDVLEWTIGKKAATLCSPEDDDVATPFDQPVSVDNKDLPANKGNPEAKPSINCYRFQGFMIKEVDMGEVGAEKLAVLPENAACEKDDANEKVIDDPIAGYFLGVKGKLAFFQAPDGSNGGMPFAVYDTTTVKKLFDDSFEGADIEKIDDAGGKLVMDYIRTYSADCSLFKDGAACGDKIKAETGLGSGTPMPDCTAAYDAEKKRTPDFAKEIEELPSVISYPVTMTFDGTKATYTARAGETSCRVPD